MSVATSLCKGTPVLAEALKVNAVYNVATNEETLMEATFKVKRADGMLVFTVGNGVELRKKFVHPSSLFFDPSREPVSDVVFDPDDPLDEYGEGGEEDGTDD